MKALISLDFLKLMKNSAKAKLYKSSRLILECKPAGSMNNAGYERLNTDK
jgi:hypothetical protein